MARRRYVARGVPGGFRIWDNRARRWWGEPCELYPDDLLAELNGPARPDQLTALQLHYRITRR